MSLTTQIKPMKLITAVSGAIGTSLGLAVGVATTPTALHAGDFHININNAPQNTTIRSNSSKETINWSN
tara:strand:- start:107 stop:313 length:207 start_codon:yes stop_codon:yes gene_type:complete